VRGALGAGGGRKIRQMLTESAVLAIAGGLAGIALAWLALRPLLALGEGSIPRAEGVGVDARVLAFALGITALCSLLFGVVPALRAGRTSPNEALRGAGRTTAGRHQVRLRGTLVTTQVALAFLLVTGAALMIRSYQALTRVDPGVDVENVLLADLALPAADYAETERVVAFTDGLIALLRALPGVSAASATSSLPLFETPPNIDFEIEGVAPPAPGQPAHSGDAFVAAPGYTGVLGIDIVQGRFIEDADRADGLPVVVVNETLARMFFGGESPIGRRMRFSDEAPWFTIVGVVGDVLHASLDAPARPGYYLPPSQVMAAFGSPSRNLTFVVRTQGDPARSAQAVRDAVRAADPTLPIIRLATMDEVLGDSVARPRFLTTLLALFGGLAATLGAIGLYGVLAYTVAQRGREHAIRMAVGAGRLTIFAGVLRGGLTLAAAGIIAGGALSLGGVRVLESQLFGVAPRDTATFITVAAGLLAVAAVASAVPALRAMRAAPLDALRQD
jgi:predicted permease